MRDEIKDYQQNLRRIYKYLKDNSSDDLTELANLRGYFDTETIDFLKEYGVFKVEEGTDFKPLERFNEDYGLFTKTNRFLLEGRYIIPIKDIEGNLLTLVGWYPDDRKYITLPSKIFNKSILFGMEQFPFSDGLVLVEGLFDSLRLRAYGVTACAIMGAKPVATQLYLASISPSVLLCPDNDNIGRGSLEKRIWGDGVYLVWHGLQFDTGEEVISIKDIDQLITIYDGYSVAEMIKSQFQNTMNRVINLNNL